MRNVRVHGINGVATRDSEDGDKGPKNGKGTVFQLLVKESQLEALTLANSLGELQLNLRPFGENEGSENTDNGESFLSWVNESQSEPEPEETLLTHSMNQLFAAQPEPATKSEPKNKMVIITPNGVKTYEWTDAHELPREAVEQAEGIASIS